MPAAMAGQQKVITENMSTICHLNDWSAIKTQQSVNVAARIKPRRSCKKPNHKIVWLAPMSLVLLHLYDSGSLVMFYTIQALLQCLEESPLWIAFFSSSCHDSAVYAVFLATLLGNGTSPMQRTTRRPTPPTFQNPAARQRSGDAASRMSRDPSSLSPFCPSVSLSRRKTGMHEHVTPTEYAE